MSWTSEIGKVLGIQVNGTDTSCPPETHALEKDADATIVKDEMMVPDASFAEAVLGFQAAHGRKMQPSV